jgi:hypothetical protein
MMNEKQLVRIQRLHLFSNGTDTVVAFDEMDAIKVWEEWSGDQWDSSYDPFERVSDRKMIKIQFEPCDFEYAKRDRPLLSKVVEKTDIEYPYIAAPAWVWALNDGRCFLCSTEW